MGECLAQVDREKLPKGFVEILEEECKGCGLCVVACPQDTLSLTDRINQRGHRYVRQTAVERCIGCTMCYTQCPSSAIVVYRLTRARAGRRSGHE